MDSDWDMARRRGARWDLSRVLPSLCLSISADRRNSSLFATTLCSLMVGCRGRTSRHQQHQASKQCRTAGNPPWWHGVWGRKSCLTQARFHSNISALHSPELKVTKSTLSQGTAMCNHSDNLGLKLCQSKQASSHGRVLGSAVCRPEWLCRSFLGSRGAY